MAVYQEKDKGTWRVVLGTPILPGKESRRRNEDSRPNGKRLPGSMK